MANSNPEGKKMKKLLIASTALVATASVAAADVTLSGYGRFGLVYLENDTDGVSDSEVEQRFRLNVNVDTTTDGGVKFGGRIRFQSDDNGIGQGGVANNSAAEFNVTAGGFRVDVGNTSDVLDSGDLFSYFGNSVGLTDFGEISSGFALPVSGFGTGTSPVDPTLKARYNAGPFTVAASYTTNALDSAEEEYQLGVGYSITDNIRAGIAGGVLETTGDDRDFYAAGVNASFGALEVDAIVADIDDSATEEIDTAWGLAFTYAVGAATSVRFVVNDAGRNDVNGAGDVGDEIAYSAGFRQSLGGGVTLRGGVGENRFGKLIGDLGVRFDF